jgi:hypothetical protein
MKRAILVALGTGVLISSAAAIGIDAAVIRAPQHEAGYWPTEETARVAQRARIDARYQVERAKCEALGGLKKDQCLIAAHAARGRALLEAAAPYQDRTSG